MNTTKEMSLPVALFVLALMIGSLIAWPLNVYRLVKCDFEPSYKGEVIHALGLFTPTYLVTAWFNFDKE